MNMCKEKQINKEAVQRLHIRSFCFKNPSVFFYFFMEQSVGNRSCIFVVDCQLFMHYFMVSFIVEGYIKCVSCLV